MDYTKKKEEPRTTVPFHNPPELQFFDTLFESAVAWFNNTETKTDTTFTNEEIGMVSPQLFVGSLHAARDTALLQALNITHILTAASRLNPYPTDTNTPIKDIKYLKLEALADHPAVDILQEIPRSLHFIADGITNGNVLVHCASGVSRSVSICCAWLMVTSKSDHTLEGALKKVRANRSQSMPNAGFRQQLMCLEETLLQLSSNTLSNTSNDANLIHLKQIESIVKTSKTSYSLKLGTSNVMANLQIQRSKANELHCKCDEQENIFKSLSNNASNEMLDKCSNILSQIVLDIDLLDKNGASVEMMDRPAKMIRKSAASKAERLLTDIARLMDTNKLKQRNIYPNLIQQYLQEPNYYHLNLSYPNLELIHTQPNIFIVKNFLTSQECNQLVKKAQNKLVPSEISGSGYGKYRTSSQIPCTQREAPTVIDKITKLLQCKANTLEKLNIIHYKQGAYYKPHCDEDDGPDTMNGFQNSMRLVSVIMYLNDVPKGGATNFLNTHQNIDEESSDDAAENDGGDGENKEVKENKEGEENDDENENKIAILPEKGMVVIHFPGTTEYEMDDRTLHEGAEAIDEKWIAVTWMWLSERVVDGYLEQDIERLSDDTI